MKKFKGNKGSDRQVLHKVTCTECGKRCSVPFRPTLDKPVLCSDCFKNDVVPKGGKGRDRKMHKAICSTCGGRCEIPFKPSNDKPIYCSNCFVKGEGAGPANVDRYAAMEAKLDRILELLEGRA